VCSIDYSAITSLISITNSVTTDYTNNPPVIVNSLSVTGTLFTIVGTDFSATLSDNNVTVDSNACANISISSDQTTLICSVNGVN